MSTKDITFQDQIQIEATADVGAGYATPVKIHVRLTRTGKGIDMLCANANGATPVNLVNFNGFFFQFTGVIPAGWRPSSVLTTGIFPCQGSALVSFAGRSGTSSLAFCTVDVNGSIFVYPATSTADTPPILEISHNVAAAFVGAATAVTLASASWTV